MLNENFIKHGFVFLEHNTYLEEKNLASLHDLKKIFDLELAEDENGPFRRRAYLKLQWERSSNQYRLSDNQNYFQTADSNAMDGGKIRQFKIMDKKILDIPIIKDLTEKNLMMIKEYKPLSEQQHLIIGIHFIRYIVNQHAASFSSPDWLHKDNEPLVFVHLIGLTRYALGGDNLIADDSKKITHVIRLENDLETLVLNQAVYHAVTPLGSRSGTSTRDVMLFTVEPAYTQVNSKQGE